MKTILRMPESIFYYIKRAGSLDQAQKRLDLWGEMEDEVQFVPPSDIRGLLSTIEVNTVEGFTGLDLIFWEGCSQNLLDGDTWVRCDHVGYYDMVLINGLYWVFAPVIAALVGESDQAFADSSAWAEKLATGGVSTMAEEIQHAYDMGVLN
ncbi:hypothetical protein ACP3V3_01955 [Vibrio sp. PNB22_3_1]